MATKTGVDSGSLTDQYSTVVWIAAVIIGLLSFPIGLIIPGYLYWKASKGEGASQSAFETWTAIILGIFGIAAVELGGRKGAKILWGIVVALFLLSVLSAVALLFV